MKHPRRNPGAAVPAPPSPLRGGIEGGGRAAGTVSTARPPPLPAGLPPLKGEGIDGTASLVLLGGRPHASPGCIRLLAPREIEADWPKLAALLAPAVTHDERRTLADVHTDLMARRLHYLALEGGGASGLAILEFATATNGASCCWVVYVAGGNSRAPRQFCRFARQLMHRFESLALACGCAEMRVEGRNWAKILTDYEALSDRPGRNELRKVL